MTIRDKELAIYEHFDNWSMNTIIIKHFVDKIKLNKLMAIWWDTEGDLCETNEGILIINLIYKQIHDDKRKT